MRAHSVQEALLRRIAQDQHVYRADYTLESLIKNSGQDTYSRVGVNQASTFTGFCNGHDTKIFRPIETRPFIATPEQCFLLAYRSVCREFFVTRAALENAIWLSRNAPREASHIAAANLAGVTAKVRDLEWHKQFYDESLLNNDFGGVESFVVEMTNTPEIASSGICHPDWDFEGRELQPLWGEHLAIVTFSIIGTDSGGAIAFVWHRSSAEVGRKLASSLNQYDDEELPNAVVRFVFSRSENNCLSPQWWESLSPEIRGSLQRRGFESASPEVAFQKDYLVDDGIRAVQWYVHDRTMSF